MMIYRVWLQWKQDFPGDYLSPLPLHMYVDASGTDQALWKTLKASSNPQIA